MYYSYACNYGYYCAYELLYNVCYLTFINFYSTFIIADLCCRCVLSFLPINEYDDDDDDVDGDDDQDQDLDHSFGV